MKTLIASATRVSDNTETRLEQSLGPLLAAGVKFDWHTVNNNTTGLSEVYNKILDEKAKDYECIVFAHDDVFIDDAFIIDKLSDGFSVAGYDIIGVAGGLNPVIRAPALWHVMCKREDLRGFAGHFTGNMSSIFMTSFGTSPSRVALLDGLFIAVNTKRVLETGWKFNEHYEFHHYDLASCLDANKLQLKLGVLPIHVIHESHGLSDANDKKFKRSEALFLAEYSK